jgi:hypothetical protein
MTARQTFFHLDFPTRDACSLEQDAYPDRWPPWLCHGCRIPKVPVVPIDVRVQDNSREIRGPMNFVMGAGLGLVRTDVLRALPQHAVERDLVLGRIFAADEVLLDDWVTFRGRHRLIIRGSKEVSTRRCTVCDRDLYDAGGKKYLFPQPVPTSEIFESDLWGLIVTENVFSQIDITPWKKLRADRLPVLDAPLDGLGVLNPD